MVIFSCAKCSKTFPNKSSYQRHHERKTPCKPVPVDKQPCQIPNFTTVYGCPFCKIHLYRFDHMAQHVGICPIKLAIIAKMDLEEQIKEKEIELRKANGFLIDDIEHPIVMEDVLKLLGKPLDTPIENYRLNVSKDEMITVLDAFPQYKSQAESMKKILDKNPTGPNANNIFTIEILPRSKEYLKKLEEIQFNKTIELLSREFDIPLDNLILL